LLASSVIALLSISQIQHLITYWNMTFNYFRAFYLAKAWTELGLTEVYNSGDWFKHHIEWAIANDDNDIVPIEMMQLNFAWKEKEYEWAKPYFTMDIESNFKYLTNNIRDTNSCNKENIITLKPWDGVMLSLFSDDTWNENFNKILSDKEDDKKFSPLKGIEDLSLVNNDNNSQLTFAFFTYDTKDGKESMQDIVVKVGWSFSEFIGDKEVKRLIKSDASKKYITIKNSWAKEETSFCITKNKKDIPSPNYLITVRGHYADMEVWLQSIVKKDIPSWSLNVLDDVKE